MDHSTLTVGRDRERAALVRAIDRARGGQLAAVAFSGEAGVGKTHLLRHGMALADSLGMTILQGGGLEMAGLPPYFGISESVGRHPEVLQRAALDEAHLGVLAGIVSGNTGPYAASEFATSFQIINAFSTLLQTLARQSGLALVIDDLQWVDRATLDLLSLVSRRLAQEPILLLLGVREELQPEVAGLLADLDQTVELDVFKVGQLESGSVAELVRGILGGEVEGDLAVEVERLSDGNPFLIGALVDEARLSGAIGLADGEWTMSGRRSLALPQRVSRLVAARMGRLSEEVRNLIEIGALVGRSFSVQLVAAVAGLDWETVSRQLQSAGPISMVRRDQGDDYVFDHDLIRWQVIEGISEPRRRRLHGDIARAKIALNQTVRAVDLAYHFRAAGEIEEAVRWSITAGREALVMHAPNEARDHLAYAIAHPHAIDESEHVAIRLMAGRALLASGDEPAAARLFLEARSEFDRERLFVNAGEAGYLLGIALWRQELVEPARAAFERAQNDYGDHEDANVVRLLADAATLIGAVQHDQTRGLHLARVSLEISRHLSDPLVEATAQRALGNLQVRSGDIVPGIGMLESALVLAEAIGDPVESAECCACLATAYFWDGALERSRQASERRLIHAERSGDRFQLRHIFTWLAMLAAQQGRMSEATGWLDRAEPSVRELASAEPSAWLTFCRGMMALMVGQPAVAIDHLEAANSAFRGMGYGTQIWYLAPLVECNIACGRVARGLALLADMDQLLEKIPADAMPPPDAVSAYASIALQLNDPDLLDRAAKLLERIRVRFADVLIDRMRAEMCLRSGEMMRAETLLADAMVVAEREDLAWERAYLLLDRSALAEATGADARIVTRLREEATELLGSLGHVHYQHGQAEAYWSPLSQRENEVLGLLVEGMSNRRIAEKLSISEKTVERHLSTIYTKLAVPNRAAAVAWALRSERRPEAPN